MVSDDATLDLSKVLIARVLDEQDGLVYVTDRDGRVVYFNRACEQSSGRTAQEVLGRPVWEVTSAESEWEACKKDYAAIRSGHSGGADEGQWTDKHGHTRTIKWRNFALLDEQGAVSQVVFTGTDISELKESEERWRWLSAATVEGITHHEKGIIVDVNQRCAEMFGYTEQEMVGQPVLNFAAPESRATILDRIRRHLEGAYEVVGLRKDGSTFPLEIATRETRANGRELRIAGLRDVSERKLIQDQLMRAQRLESVGLMAGGIAHDFNNLLSVIIGYSQSAASAPNLSSETRTDLDQVLQAARVAGNLTQQLLVFARREPLASESISVDSHMRTLLPLIEGALTENVRLELDLHDGGWPVRMSATHFEQVVFNLALNARDAMPKGGTLRVATGCVTAECGRVVTSGEVGAGDYVVMEFVDDGHGIEPDGAHRVFEPFYSTKREEGHSGLGLAVVYGIVTGIGGAIQLESEPGCGCTVRLYLPRSDAPCVAQSMGEAYKAGSGVVMLVEDQPALRKLLARMLRRSGHTVLEADSAETALDLLDNHDDHIELLVTDVIMPGRSGPELAELVKQRFPDVSVLYISGCSNDVLSNHVLDPSQFLAKPFSLEQLIDRVSQLLDARLAKVQ